MLDYHDFQIALQRSPLSSEEDQATQLLAQWQTARLKNSHRDLYENPDYKQGLDFLLTELYSGQDFSARDRDLERIFPKLIKLLPDKIITIVANLIELNFLTQKLDQALAQHLRKQSKTFAIDEDHYLHAYRATSTPTERNRQLELVNEAGILLDKHASNSLLLFSLSASEKPAAKVGLSALHGFLKRGFDAFNTMENVEALISTLIKRERQILSNIFEGKDEPFFFAS